MSTNLLLPFVKAAHSYPIPIPTACNCNGHAEACTFDQELFRSTGHGGLCLNCRDHTAGQHCERCQENFYRWNEKAQCKPCDCHSAGEWGPTDCPDTFLGLVPLPSAVLPLLQAPCTSSVTVLEPAPVRTQLLAGNVTAACQASTRLARVAAGKWEGRRRKMVVRGGGCKGSKDCR